MTSRERVKRTIYFQNLDRIPHYLPDGKENDIIWLAPWTMGPHARPPAKLPWTTIGAMDRRIDASGVTWERPARSDGNIGLVKAYPINDITEQVSYRFPDRNNPSYYVNHKKAIDENNRSANPRYALGAMGFASLNAAVHNIIGGYMYLRSLSGPENLLYFFYDQPELIHDCMKAWFDLTDAVIATHQKFVIIDEAYIAEDICYNQGCLISPDMMNEFLFPYYQQVINNIKARQIDRTRHL